MFYLSFLVILSVTIIVAYKTIAGTEKSMKVIVDRFEGDYAVVELPDKTTVDMPKKLLDPSVKEGDLIEIKMLRIATRDSKFKINKLMDEVFEKNR
jgi:hypothetical protein